MYIKITESELSFITRTTISRKIVVIIKIVIRYALMLVPTVERDRGCMFNFEIISMSVCRHPSRTKMVTDVAL